MLSKLGQVIHATNPTRGPPTCTDAVLVGKCTVTLRTPGTKLNARCTVCPQFSMHIMPVTERLMYVGASGGGDRGSGCFVASTSRAARPGLGPGGTSPATDACPPQHNDRTGTGNAASGAASGRAAAGEGAVLDEDGGGWPVDSGCFWAPLSLLL